MDSPEVSRLVVDAVHRLSGRPWVFASGVLEGAPLRIGDRVTIESDQATLAATVETVELHGRPGLVTIAVAGDLAYAVKPGSVISRRV
ncbi:hypothetical protein ACFY2R_01540 [Micromonospora olivasterospora]|uniref:Uncharacterized protein n=1 Tax=Micromonospora olivasterospora TaxID=1880 RepID=A0A562ICC4_MICOL|nr:hypothetical protein [Micromonospora olivasterospora]TWH68640.1 hypothetical protein JD77_03637 [Micromonospora olivasterospora]